MEKIALVTDSSCDLPQEIIDEYGINIIPLRIIYKSQEYRDRIDINSIEIYKNLDNEIPKTSMPSPYDVIAKIDELKQKGFTHCIAMTISSGLSGTYDMFKLVKEEIKDIHISIIDSKILSLGLGLLVYETAKMIRNGYSYDEIINKIDVFLTRVKGFFTVDTLEYLKKGGRISSFAAKIGALLNLKPIISVDEYGKYYMFSKVRGKNQAVSKMIDELMLYSKTFKSLIVGIPHANVENEANELANKIKSISSVKEIIINEVSPALGVHSGPGLIGLTFLPIE
ncbi:MAG: DegV family protein [Caloramator sp.]|nr:DegV family protein [Caloramator sp.]